MATTALSLSFGPLLACSETPPPPPAAARRDAGPPIDAWVAPFETCVDVVSEPIVERQPRSVVDIIVVVDNSSSMQAEAEQVRAGINAFADAIEGSGLDYRVIVISHPGDTGTAVCVPPPLGTGAPECVGGPDGRLLHVRQVVNSTDAPAVAIASYPTYRTFLRRESVKLFLWVTDDESELSADSFRSSLADLDGGMFASTLHHAVVGFYGETPETWFMPRPGACDSFTNIGSNYLRLALCLSDDDEEIPDCNTGTIARVCESDWTETFAAIASRTERVLIEEPVSCTLTIPDAPAGRVLDLSRLTVTYTTEGETTVLGHSALGAACTGWHYDDEMRPSAIVLCNDVCRSIQSNAGVRLEVQVACYDDPD